MGANDANRKLANEFCARLSSGNVDAVMEMFAPEATLHMMLRGDLMPMNMVTAYETPEAISGYFASAFGIYTPTHICRSLAVDGNMVVVETTSDAPLPGGGRYVNAYVFMMEMRDGKVIHMREYMDTLVSAEAMQHLLERAPEHTTTIAVSG